MTSKRTTTVPVLRRTFPSDQFHMVRKGQVWCVCPAYVMPLEDWKAWAANFKTNMVWRSNCEHCKAILARGNPLAVVMNSRRELIGIEVVNAAEFEVVSGAPSENPLLDLLYPSFGLITEGQITASPAMTESSPLTAN